MYTTVFTHPGQPGTSGTADSAFTVRLLNVVVVVVVVVVVIIIIIIIAFRPVKNFKIYPPSRKEHVHGFYGPCLRRSSCKFYPVSPTKRANVGAFYRGTEYVKCAEGYKIRAMLPKSRKATKPVTVLR